MRVSRRHAVSPPRGARDGGTVSFACQAHHHQSAPTDSAIPGPDSFRKDSSSTAPPFSPLRHSASPARQDPVPRRSNTSVVLQVLVGWLALILGLFAEEISVISLSAFPKPVDDLRRQCHGSAPSTDGRSEYRADRISEFIRPHWPLILLSQNMQESNGLLWIYRC